MPIDHKQDPNERILRYIDWSSYLYANENITASTWEVSPNEDGITLSGASFTPKIATVYVSGGAAGKTYKILNSIEAGLLKKQQAIYIHIADE